jgi:hypothetical protein
LGLEEYLVAWSAAGRYTAPPHPQPFGLSRGVLLGLPSEPHAVYVACAGGEARYVGSTTRGVATRLAEHVKVPSRAGWEELWVIGLLDGLSRYQVQLAEERVGKLVRPLENLRPAGR